MLPGILVLGTLLTAALVKLGTDVVSNVTLRIELVTPSQSRDYHKGSRDVPHISLRSLLRCNKLAEANTFCILLSPELSIPIMSLLLSVLFFSLVEGRDFQCHDNIAKCTSMVTTMLRNL